MPKRFVCRNCGNIADEEKECIGCGDRMEEVSLSRGLEGSIPFVMAGAAGILLLISFIFEIFLLIWFTFPLIGAGIIYDHLYQRNLDRTLKERIK